MIAAQVHKNTPKKPIGPVVKKNSNSGIASELTHVKPEGFIQRKSNCTCGGDCPSCQVKSNGLRVSQPNDPTEIEADRVADIVMKMSGRTIVPPEGIIQRKEIAVSGFSFPSGAANVQTAVSSGGKPLDRRIRSFFESRFGFDLSHIKIFDGEQAAKSAQSINALAYTIGDNIVFNNNQYDPQTLSGQYLLAHEIAHTLQPNKSVLKRRAIHTGRILDEGDCTHLSCNSSYACDDPQGVLCPEGTVHAGKRKKPLFSCDVTCDRSSCISNYMAIPHRRWRGVRGGQCNQDLVICANGRFTHAIVKDRSNREVWEVSPGVLSTLGVTRGDITNGAIYPDENDAAFLADSRCRQISGGGDGGTSDGGTSDGGYTLPDTFVPDGGDTVIDEVNKP